MTIVSCYSYLLIVDHQEFTVNSLRANVAIALQENILFSTSIKENIRYAVSDATDEEVYEAARITDAEGFILDQKFGYNTELGERGARLSTGQRQRLSIARAVLKNTPMTRGMPKIEKKERVKRKRHKNLK